MKGVVAILLALTAFACTEPASDSASASQSISGANDGPPVVAAPQTDSPTLRAVRARGRLLCGVNPGLPGFAYPDTRGVWRGFEADLCRAVAAAVIGNAEAVTFRPLRTEDRVSALRTGRVDLVARGTTVTLSRDGRDGVDFAAIAYYDGQGFLARRALALQSATELTGARICVQRNTVNVAGLRDWANTHALQVSERIVRDEGEGRALLQAEGCDAFSAGVAALAASRTVMDNPSAYILLPEVISRRPLGVMVREGDDGWADVVRWTINALLLAEQMGVTQRNAGEASRSPTQPEARRLLGVDGDAGAALGLRRDWALRAVRAVGNYGELFDRNIGARSPLRLQRGLNALWTATPPGLMYSPPIGEPDQPPAAPSATGRSSRPPHSAQDPS